MQPRKAKAEPLPADVQAAMAAVDAAVAKLPDIEIDLMDGEKFGTAGAETEPPHVGSKVSTPVPSAISMIILSTTLRHCFLCALCAGSNYD